MHDILIGTDKNPLTSPDKVETVAMEFLYSTKLGNKKISLYSNDLPPADFNFEYYLSNYSTYPPGDYIEPFLEDISLIVVRFIENDS